MINRGSKAKTGLSSEQDGRNGSAEIITDRQKMSAKRGKIMSKYAENYGEMLFWSLEHQMTGSEDWDFRPAENLYRDTDVGIESSYAMLVSAPDLF